MNYSVILNEIYQEVMKNLNMKDIDNKIKSGNTRLHAEAKNQIISEIQNVVPNHLKQLNKEDLTKLQKYINLFSFQNNQNIMKSTFDEYGYVYTIAYIENLTSEHILNYGQAELDNNSFQM